MLTEIEREQLKMQNKQERDGRVLDCIKALLLIDKGWSSEAIAEALFVETTEELVSFFEHPKKSYRYRYIVTIFDVTAR